MQLNIIKYAPIIEKARTSFWFVPTFMVLSAMILALCTVSIDTFYIDTIEPFFPLVYKMDIDDIRSLLGTIAGAMITVTSIAFSITIVALTMASAQFGPRLLRNFMMDTGTQVVLGSFISNFLFCILIFCAISFQEPYIFKPGLTVIVAMIMTCSSVGVLIFFIHHVSKSIQADVVIDDVCRELESSIDNLFPSSKNQEKSVSKAHSKDIGIIKRAKTLKVLAKCSGYVQTIDHEVLVTLATERNMLIECHLVPGDFVVQDAVIAIIHADIVVDEDCVNQVCDKVILGAYRTPVQDPEFAVRQLVEIALRALSPGINDPYTAITCVDKLNSVLCGLTTRIFPAMRQYDQADQLRLVCKVLTFTDLAKAAFDQIRQHANDDVAVTIRLLDSLNELMKFTKNSEQKEFVIRQSKMIKEQQSKQLLAEDDLKEINCRVAAIFK